MFRYHIFFNSEVLSHVADREDPPFRPQVDRDLCSPALYNLMEMSWTEEPRERPTFKEIRNDMKEISKYVRSPFSSAHRGGMLTHPIFNSDPTLPPLKC